MSDGDSALLYEAIRGRAEQVLDDGYPFPRVHPWWAATAEALARDVLVLLDERKGSDGA